MADLGLLQTLAEVAVALAGFSSIVAVLSSNLTERPQVTNALKSMLFVSLMVAACSLLPSVLLELQLTEVWLWRIAALILSASSFSYLAYAVRRATAAGDQIWDTRHPIRMVTVVLYPFIGMVMAIAGVGMLDGFISGLYVLGLFIYLMVSGVFFLFVFLTVASKNS